jgi:deazaflavin-dependent oxidoreductase (nitroreductase family)
MNVIERMAGSKLFSRIGPKVVPKMDRAVHKLTGGRVLPSSLYMPVLLLTAIGHKSGEPRTVPIACFPEGENLVVVASNFGREKHPAWSANLIANPLAEVEFRGRSFPVIAKLLDAEEKAERWEKITRRWPHFDTYTERSGRDLRVFLLQRA